MPHLVIDIGSGEDTHSEPVGDPFSGRIDLVDLCQRHRNATRIDRAVEPYLRISPETTHVSVTVSPTCVLFDQAAKRPVTKKLVRRYSPVEVLGKEAGVEKCRRCVRRNFEARLAEILSE